MTDNLAATAADHYYGHDHLFSTTVLFDASGDIEERCEYNAYGKCTVLQPNFTPDGDNISDYDNPYLFTGRRLDILDGNSLKIQYSRARYYDAETGRFIQRDPAGYVDGMSLYEYVSSSPVMFSDPTGLVYISPPGTGMIPPKPTPTPKMSKKCKKIKRKFDKDNLKKLKELVRGGGGLSALPAYGSMPFRHCMWNCRMTWPGGAKNIQKAKKMSALKEEMDNLAADYVVAMYKAGCWSSLPEGQQKKACEGARSADQPSDYEDNWRGMVCALQDKCPNNEAKEDACRRCCTENGVGPNTDDGPPDRGWGPRKDDIATPCSKYLGPDPA